MNEWCNTEQVLHETWSHYRAAHPGSDRRRVENEEKLIWLLAADFWQVHQFVYQLLAGELRR